MKLNVGQLNHKLRIWDNQDTSLFKTQQDIDEFLENKQIKKNVNHRKEKTTKSKNTNVMLGTRFKNEKQSSEFFEMITGDIRFDREAQINLRNKLIVEVINNKTDIPHKNEVIELLIRLWDDCNVSRRNIRKIFDEFEVLNSDQLAGYVIKQVQIRSDIIISYARGANMVEITTVEDEEFKVREMTMDEFLSKDLDVFMEWLIPLNGGLTFFKE